jgi:hypothetical protein
MKTTSTHTKRQLLQSLCGIAALPILSSCGTIIYPDRVNQKKRGDLDFIVVGMDAVGLLFFLIPGIVAFAVDFGTGAIYFPEGHEKGRRENTIFDKIDSQAKLDQREIERIVGEKTGMEINLDGEDVLTMRLDDIGEFGAACTRLSTRSMLAAK